MDAHFHRGLLLFRQDRHAQAEHEFRLALADAPDDPIAHAYLAAVLAQQGKLDPAEQEAGLAVRYGPDIPFVHFVRAQVLLARNRLPEAEAAVREALRLDPTDADYHGQLAGIRLARRDWLGALAAAEDGLAHDPNHAACSATRTMALLQLGQRGDAAAESAAALRRNPEDDAAHTARGWALLHDGKPDEALSHFREALRLDPTSEWARNGLVEALKARYWAYRQLLGFFLWMGRLGVPAQVGLIVGLLLAQQVLAGVAAANPAVAPFVAPILVAYLVFVVLTWVARPVSNLLLRLNRFGRLVLSPEEKRESAWVGLFLAAAATALAVNVAAAGDLEAVAGATGMATVLTLIPLASTFRVPAGWPRKLMAGYTAVMACVVGLMLCSFASAMTAAIEWEARQAARAGWGFFDLIRTLTLGAVVLGNVLPFVRVRR